VAEEINRGGYQLKKNPKKPITFFSIFQAAAPPPFVKKNQTPSPSQLEPVPRLSIFPAKGEKPNSQPTKSRRPLPLKNKSPIFSPFPTHKQPAAHFSPAKKKTNRAPRPFDLLLPSLAGHTDPVTRGRSTFSSPTQLLSRPPQLSHGCRFSPLLWISDPLTVPVSRPHQIRLTFGSCPNQTSQIVPPRHQQSSAASTPAKREREERRPSLMWSVPSS